MDNVGAEVGQKMRSAIKAKLLELNCYVDDELPDYIMVMVANKRSKSQMNEDLNLFLNTKTSTFVEWLHIVLKKLKEVTVTNPEVYKKVARRKSSDQPDAKVKKEKKDKNKSSEKVDENIKEEKDANESLTDNLPVSANRLSEQRKITILHSETRNEDNVDEFDIPLLSAVNTSTEKDLEDIERKIKNVKSRLGILVDSELEAEIQKIKSEQDKLEKEKIQQNSINEEFASQRIVELQTDDDNELPTQAEEPQEAFSTPPRLTLTTEPEMEPSFTPEKNRKYTPITFEEKSPPKTPKRVSVLDRLGKRANDDDSRRNRLNISEFRKDESFMRYPRENGSDRNRDRDDNRRYKKDRRRIDDKGVEERIRERKTSTKRRHSPVVDARSEVKKAENKSALSRLGVMSKIHVPQKEAEVSEPEDELKTREVRSMVQVKPRVLPADSQQPNKNLLLKAVAEAHRSVAQAARVGNRQFERGTKRKFEDDKDDNVPYTRKLSQSEKQKLRNLILAQVSLESSDSELEDKEYVPKPLKKVSVETPKYVPSSRKSVEGSGTDDKEPEKQARVTLEGFEKRLGVVKDQKNNNIEVVESEQLSTTRPSAKSRLEGRRSPSPIIFDKIKIKVSNISLKKEPNVPDKLPVVHTPLSIKNKERCKYWPSCRQSDKCEFVHPSRTCETFPSCKFGDKCIYLHPSCKFGSSCTKRGCPYSHAGGSYSLAGGPAPLGKLPVAKPSVCKFFPKCININCPFFHPRMCRFGKFCKNLGECSFVHAGVVSKGSLTWRPK
ncbi:unnamed protein product [Phaedon cochleariae]|uniref:Zinc finger CCCH domain-containing protein 14 n=1 Tax=Phaedon cochleariae TaxID=80249 RepID=A0A9N9SH89_PHACE|nr:unnamed protein product [Phaedon cochleariae]